MDSSKFFIVGANGQLGTALKKKYPDAKWADISELDITNEASVNSFDWSGIEVILNAAAYTNVDGAETPEGRVLAWKVNATAVSTLSRIASEHNITLVHISSDYVFDGTMVPHDEDESFSPLSVYGASKAAGDIAVTQTSRHYLLRTSWVIGEGTNFVRTMLELAIKGVNPTVVADQVGRLTFTSTIVNAIDHLLKTKVDYGTYNISNDGEPNSWANITRKIYELASLKNTVTDISTAEYYKGKEYIAPRPLLSELNLKKIKATGLKINNWQADLLDYISANN
ncbi:MAG: NAD(P)-dependent oxidoreductase [bacterium]